MSDDEQATAKAATTRRRRESQATSTSTAKGEQTSTTNKRKRGAVPESTDGPTPVVPTTASPRAKESTRSAAALDAPSSSTTTTSEKRARSEMASATTDRSTNPAVDNVVERLRNSKKPRVLQRHASADSVLHDTQRTVVPTSAAQQVKQSQIGLVPLGVGSRTGAGGRYVQSGNRVEQSEPATRAPTFTRFPSTPIPASSTTTVVPSAASTSTPPSRVPSPSPALATPTQPSTTKPILGSTGAPTMTPTAASTSSSRPTVPVTTTNRERDPRMRSSTAIPVANSASSTDPPVQRISAADYRNNRKTGTPSTTNETVSEMGRASDRPSASRPMSSSSASLSREETRRDLHAPSSSSSWPQNGSSNVSLRRSQSDITDARSSAHHSDRSSYEYSGDSNRHEHRYESREQFPMASGRAEDRFKSSYSHDDRDRHGRSSVDASYDRSDSSSSNSRYRESYPSRDDSYVRRDDYHASNRTQQDATPQRSTVDTSSRHTTASATPPPPPSPSSRPSVSEPVFSAHDPFLRLVVSRMASFLPSSLSAIRNQTTKGRKLRFYLDYTQRVHDYCGSLVKVSVQDGVGRVTVDDREWLVVRRSSNTQDLYHVLLERLLSYSEAWREVIMGAKDQRGQGERMYGDRYVLGPSFLKLWSSLKQRRHSTTNCLMLQQVYVKGYSRHHWRFMIGQVEVGSGSDLDKTMALHKATDDAMEFLLSLELFPDREKHQVAERDRPRSSTTNTARGSSRSSSVTSRTSDSGDTRARQSDGGSTSSTTVPTPTHPTTPVAPEPPAATTSQASTSRANETPTHTRAFIQDSPTAPSRTRSDSWNGAAELDAQFSPPTRSVHGEDEDAMDISDEEGIGVTTKVADKTSDARAVESESKATVDGSASTSSCAFCAELQAQKPGTKCLRCMHGSSASSSSGRSTSSFSASRSVDALHSFLRQSSSSDSTATPVTSAPATSTASSMAAHIQSAIQRLRDGLRR